MLGAPPTKRQDNNGTVKPVNSYKLPRDIGPGLLKFCLTHTDSPNLKDTVLPDRDPQDYDWLRKAFDDLEDDAKKMKKINELLSNPQTPQDKILISLEQLEFFIEDIDNSGDYIKIGGVPILVELMKNENENIRAEAASCMTIVCQNEDSIQGYLKEIGVLDLVIHLIGREHNPKCREKYLSLISSLIGNVDKLDQSKADIVLKVCVSFLSPTVDIMIPNASSGQLTTYSINNSVTGMTKAAHILKKILQGKPSLKLKGIEWGIVEALINLIRSYNNSMNKDIHMTIMCEKCESALLELITNNLNNKKQCIALGLEDQLNIRLHRLISSVDDHNDEIETLNLIKSKLEG